MEVFQKLNTRQRRMVTKAIGENRDVVLIHKYSSPRTHAQAMGFHKYSVVNLKTGEKILIER